MTTSSRPDEEDIPFDEEDDYRTEQKTIASNWPDRIDPIPTFWPTSNWWGSIDPIRNDAGGQSRQSNRIPTYTPNKNRADSGGSGARSSSSRPSPYLQLLLAGLVQVRWLMWADGQTPLLGRRLLVAVVAVASRFHILAWSTSNSPRVFIFFFKFK